jgi:hypothetical protein
LETCVARLVDGNIECHKSKIHLAVRHQRTEPERKKSWSRILVLAQDHYNFSKAPSSINEVDDTKALAFLGGRFESSAEDSVDVDFKLYNDGVIADTRRSTKVSDQFVENLLNTAAKLYKLNYRPDMVRRKLYLSEINLKSDRHLETAYAGFKEFGDKLFDVLGRKFEFSSVAWWTDPETPNRNVQFRFERKLGAAFSEQRYYSSAPMQTEDNLKLLEALEKILVG